MNQAGVGPLPGGDRGKLHFHTFSKRGARLLAVAGVVAGCAAHPAWAEDVPVPRASPLNDAPPVTEESLLEAGSAPPGFAAENFEPVQRLEAFEAATGVDLREVAQGATDPLTLAPLADPIDPFATMPNAPIDLRGSTSGDVPLQGDPTALGSYTLDARMTTDGPPIETGVVWRVYADDDPEGKMRLVGQAEGGPVTLRLKPGEYFVHAAFGRAGMTRRVSVSQIPGAESVVLDAGGIRLMALAGQDRPIAPEEVFFDIYASDESDPDGRITVMENAPAAAVIGLTAGTYHVVCRYGDANAIVRADIRVEAGKLTEATVYQQAARVTLKLVENHGGEALANTSWSVVTAAGESIAESVGAFPSMVLAAGEYTAIARHSGAIFEQKFNVEAGLNRDVEVLQE